MYYRKLKGLTSHTRGFELSVPFSIGKSTSKGIDLLISKKYHNYLTSLSYSFSDTEFVFDKSINQGKSFKGNNNIAHSFCWSHAYQWKNLQFSLSWKYRSGTPYTPVLDYTTEGSSTPYPIYDVINSKNLPDYHRLDFSVVYNFNWSSKNDRFKSRLGFSLLNLYDKKNIIRRTSLYQYKDGGNTTYDWWASDILSLGFTPNITFRLSF